MKLLPIIGLMFSLLTISWIAPNEKTIDLSGECKIPFWGKHLITICIDNRTKEIDPGLNSHSISDHTQTNWNGMVGKQIQVNHQPMFLRGTLECAIFPKTGYPATDTEEWLRIFRICHAHGLNHMRFYSWCPPEAQQYFTVLKNTNLVINLIQRLNWMRI